MPNLCKFIDTAGGEASSIILHNDARNWIFERFVKFAKTSDNEIDEVVDISICFLFIIDGIVIFVSIFFPYSEKVVDWVVHDLQNLFGNEFFLARTVNTSPSSMVSYNFMIIILIQMFKLHF